MKSYDVTATGNQWHFVSDHLPVGVRSGDLTMASWNMLQEKYVKYIVQNGQGLAGSCITEMQKEPLRGRLTLREEISAQMALEMIASFDVVALQEASLIVGQYIRRHRDHGTVEIVSPAAIKHSSQIFFYRKLIFDYVDATYFAFDESSSKVIFLMTLFYKPLQKTITFCNVHLPFVNTPSVTELTLSKIAARVNESDMIVVMGDMNMDIYTFLSQLHSKPSMTSFQAFPSSYPTHINKDQQACWYDGIYIQNPLETTQACSSTAFPKDKVCSLGGKAYTVFGLSSMDGWFHTRCV